MMIRRSTAALVFIASTLGAMAPLDGVEQRSVEIGLGISEAPRLPAWVSRPRQTGPASEIPESGLFIHRVRSGDTLQKIALLYRVDSAEVAVLNHQDPETPLHEGQTLRIPES